MKQAVFRERNKRYYRVLHTPIWIWVFWVLPGWPLTYDLYTRGPDRRHWIWLAVILVVVAWRGLAGLPETWSVSAFPLKAADFIRRGIAAGPALGAALRAAEEAWIAADFPADRTAIELIAERAASDAAKTG